MDLDDTKSSTAASSGTGGSPWDEPIDLPKDEGPKIIGTLEQKTDDLPEKEEKPVPFNIPKEIDEQVGKKVPASAVASNDQVPSRMKKEDSDITDASNKINQNIAEPAENPSLPPKPTPALSPALPSLPVLDPSGKPIIENGNVQNDLSTENNTDPKGISSVIPQTKEVQKANVATDNLQSALPPIALAVAPPAAPIQPALGVEHTVDNITKSSKAGFLPPAANINDLAPKKRGLLGLFGKKTKPEPVPAPKQNEEPTAPIIPPQSNTVPLGDNSAKFPPQPVPISAKPLDGKKNKSLIAAPPTFAKRGKPSFLKKPGFVITSCIILLLVAVTFLTEAGVMSMGLENIYGAVGLETLWGGLPKNPEKAISMAVVKNTNHLNFKISGSLSLTVNKTVKSDITSPLVVMTSIPIASRDQEVGSVISAVLSQYEDYYSTDSTSSSSSDPASSPSSVPTSDTATPSVDSATSSSSTAPVSSIGDQSQYPSYTSTETSIKQLDFSFSGSSNKDSASTEITVKKLVGTDSKISLINSKNDLYVKTSSDIKFDAKADPNKWLDYKINSLSDSNNGVSQFFSAKPDQNFSIIGSRIANEKISGVRCYNYQIDKLEVGSMFESLGIKSEMIQKINGNVWIGVSDHLIHKIDLIIIPSISSSVTRAEVIIELNSYDIENNINVPSLDDKIDVGSSATPPSESSVPATTPAETSAPSTTTSATTASQNDSLRRTDLAKIKGGLEAYKKKYGRYPVSSSLLHLDTSGNMVSKALVPTYIDAMPADPKASEGWFYGYTSNGKTFKLSARFEDLTDTQITKVGDIYLHYVYND